MAASSLGAKSSHPIKTEATYPMHSPNDSPQKNEWHWIVNPPVQRFTNRTLRPKHPCVDAETLTSTSPDETRSAAVARGPDHHHLAQRHLHRPEHRQPEEHHHQEHHRQPQRPEPGLCLHPEHRRPARQTHAPSE